MLSPAQDYHCKCRSGDRRLVKMPAGGGGGGGGGGGFGGGGGYYSSGSGGGGGWGSLVAVVITVIVIVVIAIPVGITTNRSDVPVFFSPGDTRLISYGPSFFCAGITLVDRSNSTDSTVYLVTETPPLTDQNNFTFNSSINLADNIYNYWNYYLYPNSNFSTAVCTRPNSASGTFYLIRGRGNFQKWIDDPSTDEAIAFFSITSITCSVENSRRFSFQVEFEDEYYFVYYNNRGRNTLPFLRLDITISVDRFQYSTSDLESVANCSAPTIGECSLTVPYGSNYRALIVTDIPDNPDWEENVEVSLHCSNRAWAFAVVVLVPIFAVVGCVAAAVLGCVCWAKWDSVKNCCSGRIQSSSWSPTPTFGLTRQGQQPTSSAYPTQPTNSFPRGGFPEPQGDPPATDPLDGKQDLTTIPPPTYGASLAYPPIVNPPKVDDQLPPPYSEFTTNSNI